MLERLELKEDLFSSLIKRNKGRYQGNMKELKLILLMGLLEMEGNLIHWVPTTYRHLKTWSLKFLFWKNPLGQMLLFHVSETSDLAGIVSFCVPHLCCLSTQDLSSSVTRIAPRRAHTSNHQRFLTTLENYGQNVLLMTIVVCLCLQILTSSKFSGELNGVCPITNGALDLNPATQPLLLWRCLSSQIWKV